MEPLLLFVFVGGWGGGGGWMLSTIFAVQALCKLAVCLILFFVLLCAIFAIFTSTNFTCKSYAGFSFSYLATTPPPHSPPKKESQLGWSVWVVIYGDLCILLRVRCAVYITIKKI